MPLSVFLSIIFLFHLKIVLSIHQVLWMYKAVYTVFTLGWLVDC